MGRKKTVDREQVLDAAERVIAERGAGALSIGAVAEAAGISKGGVQSSFGTKEELVVAMLDRWMDGEQQRFTERAGDEPTTVGRIRAHLLVTRDDDEASQTRAATLLVALVQSPEHLAHARRWYRKRMGTLLKEQSSRARVAFLAAEGAFFLRYLGLVPIDAATWKGIFKDLEASLRE
ncbi:MAG TPA: TetR/AcrR family transcriptional regulator [Polyangiales bacterium]|nr:TetR/AcrR family transcriptional regulator [Polyangiales bacterium]